MRTFLQVSSAVRMWNDNWLERWLCCGWWESDGRTHFTGSLQRIPDQIQIESSFIMSSGNYSSIYRWLLMTSNARASGALKEMLQSDISKLLQEQNLGIRLFRKSDPELANKYRALKKRTLQLKRRLDSLWFIFAHIVEKKLWSRPISDWTMGLSNAWFPKE